VEGAVGGVDHAGDVDEMGAVAIGLDKGSHQGGGGRVFGFELTLDFIGPHLVVAIVEAAELPFVLDHQIEEVALVDVGGELVVVLGAQSVVFGGIFAGEEGGLAH
jgi:hypothetical protein